MNSVISTGTVGSIQAEDNIFWLEVHRSIWDAQAKQNVDSVMYLQVVVLGNRAGEVFANLSLSDRVSVVGQLVGNEEYGSPLFFEGDDGEIYPQYVVHTYPSSITNLEKEDLHVFIGLGNFGKDPESRYTADGKKVANASIAFSHGSGESKGTTWMKFSAWGKTGDILESFAKGAKVLIMGVFNFDPKTGGPRKWEGKNGVGASFEATALAVYSATKKGESGDGTPAPSRSVYTSIPEEEIPF